MSKRRALRIRFSHRTRRSRSPRSGSCPVGVVVGNQVTRHPPTSDAQIRNPQGRAVSAEALFRYRPGVQEQPTAISRSGSRRVTHCPEPTV
jgi:hypothetical protein